ncbi:MAG TPA: hypothetical protein EYG86_07135 [Crocinitomicaceae bacterium]|nr:hypothetical protein [Crocinitomicaceae bacterium]
MLRTKLVPESKIVTVYQGTDEYSARIFKLKLEDEGIKVQLIDERDSSYNAFGYVYLKVLKENEQLAKQIIGHTNE